MHRVSPEGTAQAGTEMGMLYSYVAPANTGPIVPVATTASPGSATASRERRNATSTFGLGQASRMFIDVKRTFRVMLPVEPAKKKPREPKVRAHPALAAKPQPL